MRLRNPARWAASGALAAAVGLLATTAAPAQAAITPHPVSPNVVTPQVVAPQVVDPPPAAPEPPPTDPPATASPATTSQPEDPPPAAPIQTSDSGPQSLIEGCWRGTNRCIEEEELREAVLLKQREEEEAEKQRQARHVANNLPWNPIKRFLCPLYIPLDGALHEQLDQEQEIRLYGTPFSDVNIFVELIDLSTAIRGLGCITRVTP